MRLGSFLLGFSILLLGSMLAAVAQSLPRDEQPLQSEGSEISAVATPQSAPLAASEPKAKPKEEPKAEPKIEPKVETKVEPKVETKVEPKVETAAAEASAPIAQSEPVAQSAPIAQSTPLEKPVQVEQSAPVAEVAAAKVSEPLPASDQSAPAAQLSPMDASAPLASPTLTEQSVPVGTLAPTERPVVETPAEKPTSSKPQTDPVPTVTDATSASPPSLPASNKDPSKDPIIPSPRRPADKVLTTEVRPPEPAPKPAPKAAPKPTPAANPTPAPASAKADLTVKPTQVAVIVPKAHPWVSNCKVTQMQGSVLMCDADSLLAMPSDTVQVYVRDAALIKLEGRFVVRENLPMNYRFFVLP